MCSPSQMISLSKRRWFHRAGRCEVCAGRRLLEEIIEERIERNPEFPRMGAVAIARRCVPGCDPGDCECSV